MLKPDREFIEFDRLQRVKHAPPKPFDALGGEVVEFFKHSVQKRQSRLGRIAESWAALVPQLLAEHCCLESLSRGTLTVLVDSSAHLYDLKQLLLAGLEQQLLLACRQAGLKKIALKRGRWYEGEGDGGQRVRFD
jgi:hypothetical protein